MFMDVFIYVLFIFYLYFIAYLQHVIVYRLQRATAEADRLHADKAALEAKMAEYSIDTSQYSVTAAKAEQDLITNLQTRLKVTDNNMFALCQSYHIVIRL